MNRAFLKSAGRHVLSATLAALGAEFATQQDDPRLGALFVLLAALAGIGAKALDRSEPDYGRTSPPATQPPSDPPPVEEPVEVPADTAGPAD